jgi:hypothetical protein
MITKSRILSILCLLSLALSVVVTAPDWVSCKDICPDEFMDLSFGPVEAVVEAGTGEVQFVHFFVYPLRASFFPPGSELSSNRSFPLDFAETPTLSEEHAGVILRI